MLTFLGDALGLNAQANELSGVWRKDDKPHESCLLMDNPITQNDTRQLFVEKATHCQTDLFSRLRQDDTLHSRTLEDLKRAVTSAYSQECGGLRRSAECDTDLKWQYDLLESSSSILIDLDPTQKRTCAKVMEQAAGRPREGEAPASVVMDPETHFGHYFDVRNGSGQRPEFRMIGPAWHTFDWTTGGEDLPGMPGGGKSANGNYGWRRRAHKERQWIYEPYRSSAKTTRFRPPASASSSAEPPRSARTTRKGTPATLIDLHEPDPSDDAWEDVEDEDSNGEEVSDGNISDGSDPWSPSTRSRPAARVGDPAVMLTAKEASHFDGHLSFSPPPDPRTDETALRALQSRTANLQSSEVSISSPSASTTWSGAVVELEELDAAGHSRINVRRQ